MVSTSKEKAFKEESKGQETSWKCLKSGIFGGLFDQGYWFQVPREFLKIIGDGNAAFFLAYLTDGYRFYSHYMHNHDGWFYRTSDATQQVLGLNYKQQLRAIEKLRQLDFVEVCRMGKDGLRHFRINEKAVFAAVMQERSSDLLNPDMPKTAYPNLPDMPKTADPDMPKTAYRVRTRRKEEQGRKKEETTSCPPDGFAGSAGSSLGGPVTALPANSRSKEIDRVWAEYKKYHARSILVEKRRKLILARLKEGFSVEMLIAAIEGNHLDPHCNGQNDRGTEYHSIELILRDADHVERYAAQAEKSKSAADKWWNMPSSQLNYYQREELREKVDRLRAEIDQEWELQFNASSSTRKCNPIEERNTIAKSLGYPGYAYKCWPCCLEYEERRNGS